MKDIETFLMQCDAFWVITNNQQFPAARPFGVAMAVDNRLFICTGKTKDVFKQIISDNHIQVVGKKKDSRQWIRITALAKANDDAKLKQMMLDKYPVLKNIYEGDKINNFVLVELEVQKKEIY